METKWHRFHWGVTKMWWRMHGLTRQEFPPFPFALTILGFIGIFAFPEPLKPFATWVFIVFGGFLGGFLLFYAPYKFHLETVRALQLEIEDLKERLQDLKKPC